MKKHTYIIISVMVLFSSLASQPFTCEAIDNNVYTMASILRGEAPQDCFMCRMVTAKAIVEDHKKGVDLFSRWYGWRAARPQDIRVIENMLNNPTTRAKYPSCRFVGKPTDLNVWAPRGYTDDVEIKVYCSRHGCSVCVPYKEKPKPKYEYQ